MVWGGSVGCKDQLLGSPGDITPRDPSFKWVTKDFEVYGTSYLMNDINECFCFEERKAIWNKMVDELMMHMK